MAIKKKKKKIEIQTPREVALGQSKMGGQYYDPTTREPIAEPKPAEPKRYTISGRGQVSPEEYKKELAGRKIVAAGGREVGAEEKKLEEVAPELEKTFEERRVFEEPVVEPIIPPEQENLGVMLRIAKSLIPKSLTKVYKDIDKLGGLVDLSSQEPISQAEITMLDADLKEGIISETSAEMDVRVEETEKILIENGIPLFPIVAGAVAVGAVGGPVKEFVGTDGQIASLELALSQYNEMITIPARSLTSGLPPNIAFDKYDRMEEGILALESQLKLSALTSPKVALALRGRGVEARLLKLKEKLQEGRRMVALRMTQEVTGEIDVPTSMAYLRKLQNER